MQHQATESKHRLTFLTGHLSLHSPAVTLTNWRTLLQSPVNRTWPSMPKIPHFRYIAQHL
ncbi:hypothetical protein TYRP_001845 [Tyrophagus putrescentiae]|nr:hypothetical protein TYRP_001845 [Tyrophagus putrescentiae]